MSETASNQAQTGDSAPATRQATPPGNSAIAIDPQKVLEQAREVLKIEAGAVSALATQIDESFVTAVRIILECRGRLVVSGIGKSGHIASKLAATFASTGTPAFFVHPAEASHGDLGMITPSDVMICLSNSGSTQELVSIVPLVKRSGASLIAMTGNSQSRLATLADVHLHVAIEREACPMNLAPTASTTAALALGDALAVAVLQARDFGSNDFAKSHPGGALGRRLLTRVADLMHTDDDLPVVSTGTLVTQAIVEITRKKLGMTAILNSDRTLAGIFTDGDLRRLLERGDDVRGLKVEQVMTRTPSTIRPEALAAEALRLMETGKHGQLLVIDDQSRLVGALNFQDLLVAKII